MDLNGCGAVAVYNILYAHGMVDSFTDTLYRLEKAVFMLGYLGSSPTAINKYFKSIGFLTKTVFRKKNVLKIKSRSACVVHLFIRSDLSAHYVTGIPAGEGKFRFFNSAVKSAEPLTMEEYLEETEKASIKQKHPVIFHSMLLVKKKAH